MSPRVDAILQIALKLGPTERAELAERILASFDTSNRAAIDSLWVRESEDRIDAYDRGEIESISDSDVFEEIERLK